MRLGTAHRAALEFTVESVSVSFASAVDELIAALSGRVVEPASEVATATPAVSRQTAAICTQMHSALDRTVVGRIKLTILATIDVRPTTLASLSH